MSKHTKSKGVEQMAGSKKSMKSRALRVVAMVILVALASAPAWAGGGGGDGSSDAPKQTVAVESTTAVASLSMTGCGVASDVRQSGCETTVKMSGDSANTCTDDRTYLDGNTLNGQCTLRGVRKAAGSAPMKVSSNGCSYVTMFRPKNYGESEVRFVDPAGVAWTLEQFMVRGENYQRTEAGDTWQMSNGLNGTGSWVLLTSGRRQIVAAVNGVMVSTGDCANGVDSSSFKLVFTAVGFVQQ